MGTRAWPLIPNRPFEKAIEHYRQIADSGTDALRMAADRHPALLAKFQREGIEIAEKTNDRPSGIDGDPLAAQAFELLAEGIRAREGVSRTEAMRRAARQRPDLLEAYRCS